MTAETHFDDGSEPTGVRRQVVVRGLNEEIRSLADPVGAEGDFDLVCECTNGGCFERLTVSLEEYETIRRIPTRFAVKPGHADASVERVVEETPRFEVIEKIGADAEQVIVNDPRRPARSKAGVA